MITATVGRKVWYRPNALDRAGFGGMVGVAGHPLDATVVAVHGDRCVNLVVFDASGTMFKRHSVTLLQDDDKPMHEDVSYAEWMPYQLKASAQIT